MKRTPHQGGYGTFGHHWDLIEPMPGEREDGSSRVGLTPDDLKDIPDGALVEMKVQGRMMARFLRWYRRWRFLTAYRILRNEYERHLVAGHDAHFRAINEARVDWECVDCPWFGILHDQG